MNTPTSRYATQLLKLNTELAELAQRCSDHEWETICHNDERSIGAVVYHVAQTHADFLHIVDRLVAGGTYTPQQTLDDVHAANAEQAHEHRTADRDHSIALLKSNGQALAASVARIPGDLERQAGVFGGNPLSVAQVLEWIVVGHVREHLGNIQATATPPVAS